MTRTIVSISRIDAITFGLISVFFSQKEGSTDCGSSICQKDWLWDNIQVTHALFPYWYPTIYTKQGTSDIEETLLQSS